MATYKVLVIAMTIKNNKIAKCKELVDESQLNSSAEELIKGGFIEKVAEVEVENLTVISEEVKPKGSKSKK